MTGLIMRDAKKLGDSLIKTGWRTPDTYSKHFAPIPKESAVYLFMLFRSSEYFESLVAYVGMSTNLQQRLASHNVLPQIDKPGYYVQRWFKPTATKDLRSVEAHYITMFDPAWNVIGRPRGLLLA